MVATLVIIHLVTEFQRASAAGTAGAYFYLVDKRTCVRYNDYIAILVMCGHGE